MSERLRIKIEFFSEPGPGGDAMDALCARINRDAERERRTPEMQALHMLEWASTVAMKERAEVSRQGFHAIPQEFARAYRLAALKAAGILEG